MSQKRLALSILSIDFTRLGEQILEAEKFGGDCFHLDIMDGHFVPNISFGSEIVSQVNCLTDKFLDTHLMITNPDRYLKSFVKAGADIITVHAEACPHLHRTLENIKALGCQAGVALNPATPLSVIEEVLPMLDQVILMSVNPGFGGQKLIPQIFLKLEKLNGVLYKQGLSNVVIEVDGGVNRFNINDLIKSGAKRLVLGSAVFNQHATIKENLSQIFSLIS